jgi:hypothetical protein
MNEQELRNTIREYLEFMLSEQDIETSLFSPAEEKFLAKFVELESTSLGILYAKSLTGIREFLNRSGKDFNLTPAILNNLLKNKTISIVPYGGYSRNEDYTIQLNIPLEDLEGLKGQEGGEEGGDAAPAADAPPVAEESVEKLAQNIVAEAKKSKKKKKSKVHTSKSRALKRLPRGYVTYLEKIIQVLGEKVKNDMEKEHLVADILDNLSHNFGLTPKQVYRSYIYYKSQNRLANIIKDNND